MKALKLSTGKPVDVAPAVAYSQGYATIGEHQSVLFVLNLKRQVVPVSFEKFAANRDQYIHPAELKEAQV